jgi:DnaK suppressor protein
MTQEEIEAQRALISQRIKQIRDSLPYLNEETQPIAPSVSLGRLTRMEAINDKGVAEHVLDQARKSLERLQNALRRIEQGTYGTCLRCGKEIPIARLQHVPEALFCVPCADKKSGK